MRTTTLALASGLAASAAAETIQGVLVFARHGDRTTKHYGNQVLTKLGTKQLFEVGSDYRARYLDSDSPHRIQGISEFEYVAAQIEASAPDQSILLGTATAFLQGLYPPLDDVQPKVAAQELANGSSVTSPLNGYQYVTLHGINDDSPETIWIKGDDDCPVVSRASADFKTSAEFEARLAATRDFYQRMHPLVADIFTLEEMSYANAYGIFDVINVQHIHNATSAAANISAADLFQLRTLADSAEFALNYNISQPSRSIHASTLSGAVLSHLNTTLSSTTNTPKFTLLAGSYDTFLAFFGLANLSTLSDNFQGLPEYASTMAFELFTPTTEFKAEDVRVRFLFRNGTEGKLTAFPLFGSGKADLSWDEFEKGMGERGISTVEGWCDACQSEAGFCAVYDEGKATGVSVGSMGDDAGVSKGSWIAVLVVMAVAVVGNLVWFGLWVAGKRREKAQRGAVAAGGMKQVGSVRSDGDSV